MDVKPVLRSQYQAALSMLRQCVERCPDQVWTSGASPRTFWRIAYHAAFYTHLYLMPDEHAFVPWSLHRENTPALWGSPEELEPYCRQEFLGYLDWLKGEVPSMLAALDLESEVSGFHWYPGIGKLEHQAMNLRHLQGHVGQLSELLMARGVDLDWKSKG